MALRNQEIAQRIKELREGRGMPPQPVVAAAVGVSLRTYQNWEGGDAKPEYRNLERLAEFYGVSEEFILTGSENSRPESPVVVSETVEGGFEEFRAYVDELKEGLATIDQRLDDAESDRERMRQLIDQQNNNLLEQTVLLRELRAVVQALPAMREALTLLEEAGGLPKPAAKPATGRAPAEGQDRRRGERRQTG